MEPDQTSDKIGKVPHPTKLFNLQNFPFKGWETRQVYGVLICAIVLVSVHRHLPNTKQHKKYAKADITLLKLYSNVLFNL